jgi:hypothetical protein
MNGHDIQFIVRDFNTDIWIPRSTRAEAEALRDALNSNGYGVELSITVYDATSDEVISHDKVENDG